MTVMFSLESRIDLKSVEKVIPDSIYNPHTFSAVKVRELQPNYSALVFNSGKVVITGVTSFEKANIAAQHLFERLKLIFNVTFGELTIRNLVGSFHLGNPVNLVAFYNSNKQRCSYEIELFPALFFKPREYRGTVTIFRTGHVNITGVSSLENLEELAEYVRTLF